MITRDQKTDLRKMSDAIGFDYAFFRSSLPDEIKDARFQELLREYRRAGKSLTKYVGINKLSP